jgi:hypothetical protein
MLTYAGLDKDEVHPIPEEPPVKGSSHTPIYLGPRDDHKQTRGTWFLKASNGRFAIVTNVRRPWSYSMLLDNPAVRALPCARARKEQRLRRTNERKKGCGARTMSSFGLSSAKRAAAHESSPSLGSRAQKEQRLHHLLLWALERKKSGGCGAQTISFFVLSSLALSPPPRPARIANSRSLLSGLPLTPCTHARAQYFGYLCKFASVIALGVLVVSAKVHYGGIMKQIDARENYVYEVFKYQMEDHEDAAPVQFLLK